MKPFRPRLSLTLAAVMLAVIALRADLQPQPAPAAAIQDLQGVAELKAMFNRDAGRVRVILLLSPT
jgi:hypothetical protein